MGQRYRTKLLLKLFPSVPKGRFGSKRMTRFLEERVFYREFGFSPWKLTFLALALVLLGAWALASLGFAWSAVDQASRLESRLVATEGELRIERERLARARRDYYVLLSRLEPLNDKVEDLAGFSRKLAIVAGVSEIAEDLGSTAEQRRMDVRLTESEIAALDRRFERLGTFMHDQETQLARTPSISPLKGTFVPTDRYGYRVSRFIRQSGDGRGGTDDRRFHAGLDLAAPVGTPVHATADGVVHFAGRIPARQSLSASYYGNFVVLDHENGMRTVYAHCDALDVETGDRVRRGDIVGWVGSTGRSTGPHLHYEVVVDGRPLDPELFVIDVDIPDRRVRVDFEEDSLLVDEVERLFGG